MYTKLIKAFRYLTREGFQFAVDQIKLCYPWLRTKKDETEKSVKQIKNEAVPAIAKTTDEVSKYVLKKYEEAKKMRKKAEKERKRAKMNSIRNTIIATTLGFGAGAATGYVLVKKSQIKESDYVFKDDEVVESTPFKKKETKFSVPGNTVKFGDQIKMNTEFDSRYSVSEDGINLIKK